MYYFNTERHSAFPHRNKVVLWALSSSEQRCKSLIENTTESLRPRKPEALTVLAGSDSSTQLRNTSPRDPWLQIPKRRAQLRLSSFTSCSSAHVNVTLTTWTQQVTHILIALHSWKRLWGSEHSDCHTDKHFKVWNLSGEEEIYLSADGFGYVGNKLKNLRLNLNGKQKGCIKTKVLTYGEKKKSILINTVERLHI